MKLAEILSLFETIAPGSLQESYDNSGLIVDNAADEVHKALLCLDSTEAVVDEAISTGCDLIVAHHPIVFGGMKRFNGNTYVERTVMKAIRHGIAIYACHTNLDNVLHRGVNSKIASKLGLQHCRILQPKKGLLQKLVVFVPDAHATEVANAMFGAGAGHVGNYDECSFQLHGTGTFRAGEGANPFVGEHGQRHEESETRIEVLVPQVRSRAVVSAMLAAHPYEEVAYDLYPLHNNWIETGSGLVGELSQPLSQAEFLQHLKQGMELPLIRHTVGNGGLVSTVAVCGGAGSFLIRDAIGAGADAYVTADVKYHEFFDAENKLMLCDIGHYDSEKYTIELFSEVLSDKFPNFATIFSKTVTNPVHNYY